MFVCLFVCVCVCVRQAVHSFRGVILGVCVIVYDPEVLRMRQPRPKLGCCTTEKKGDGLCKNENNFYSFFFVTH